MTVDIQVPAVGESITEGTVARWLKKDGERVRADEPVLELETEKATTEITAPAAGVLRTLVPEGQTVAIGAVVARIEEGGKAEVAREEKRSARAAGPEKNDQKKAQPAPEGPTPVEAKPLSPAARRLAEEEEVDVARLKGTGRGGRVTKEDVLGFLQRQPPAAPPEPPARPEGPPSTPHERREPMSGIRRRIAERLVISQQTTATLTTFNEADLSAVLELRGRYKERFQEKHGVGLGFMAFFVKAAVEALKAFPAANAWIDGGDVVFHDYYHIGVAVSTERGLMVPVVRDADRLGFAEVERRIADMARKAREGKVSVTDLQGGTFTITNGGVFGSLLSTPILNPPQSAILGMHVIQKRPVAVGEQVVVRPMMYLALSYDHRLIDGREAVLFLARVKECVEHPERLLLEV